MSSIHSLNRRTFLSTGASLVATGASLMIWPNAFAAPQDAGKQAHHSDDEMHECVRLCQDCHALCIQTFTHCLTLGGRHAALDHIRLLLDCADMCETTAQYLLRGSSLHQRVCGLCAEVCRQCADNCLQLGGDDPMLKQCAEMCRRCAASCEHMASKVAA